MDEAMKHPLRALREARGLSMADFAELLRIPKPTLQIRERGILPDVREGQRIAAVLGVPVAELWPVELPAEDSTEEG